MPETLSNLLPILGILGLIIWAVMVGRRRARRLQSKESVFSHDNKGAGHALQRAMEELQVNVMEFTRDIEGRLDTRMHALENLIRDADERIRRLEELSGAPHREPSPQTPPLHAEIYSLADQGFDKIEIARRTSTNPGEVELILGLRESRGE